MGSRDLSHIFRIIFAGLIVQLEKEAPYAMCSNVRVYMYRTHVRTKRLGAINRAELELAKPSGRIEMESLPTNAVAPLELLLYGWMQAEHYEAIRFP